MAGGGQRQPRGLGKAVDRGLHTLPSIEGTRLRRTRAVSAPGSLIQRPQECLASVPRILPCSSYRINYSPLLWLILAMREAPADISERRAQPETRL